MNNLVTPDRSLARSANVSVNGDATPRAFGAPPTGSWETIGTAPLTVSLLAGVNTLKFSNPTGAGPSIDRIEVVFMADPTCAPGAIDMAEVLDASGSMAGLWLVGTEAAAKLLVDQLQWQLDQTAVISYNTTHTMHSELTHDGATAKIAIDRITAATPAATVSTTALLSKFYRSTTGGHFQIMPGEQPLFERWLATIAFNPTTGWIADNTSGVSWDSPSLTWVGSDPVNRYTGSTKVSGNGYTAYEGVLSNFKSAHTGSLLVTAAGDYTLTIDSDSGSLIGIGNGAQRVSGPLEGGSSSVPDSLWALGQLTVEGLHSSTKFGA